MNPRYIWATTAIHALGDISRDDGDMAVVYDEYPLGEDVELAHPPTTGLDQNTAAVLDLVESDHRRSYDRDRIDDAVRRVAMRDGGTVFTEYLGLQLLDHLAAERAA